MVAAVMVMLFLMVVMVALSLLLIEISILVPPIVENSALSQLLDLLCIIGHEGIGLLWSWVPCVNRGWWLVLIGNHKALLHWP